MELLLQSDNDSFISDWHKALTDAIHTYVRLLFSSLYSSNMHELNLRLNSNHSDPCTDINVFHIADVGV